MRNGLVLVILMSVLGMGCAPPPSSDSSLTSAQPKILAATAETAKPWTGLEANDSPDNFHFVVVTDRTCCHRPGVFAGAMPKVNLLEPAFVLSVGDLIEGYTEDQVRLDAEWDEMEGFIGQLETPFFYTPGNHDMSNAVMAETWRQRFGPSFYDFRYKDVLFVVLNSELFGMVSQPDVPLPGPWQQSEQMAYIEGVLAENQDVRWTVVLVHQPLWDTKNIDEDWLRVEQMLGSRPYTVFAGHYHRYTKAVRHDRSYVTLATTGGGSGLRGPIFGEFDHVAWVTMTDNGPRIANLELDGIHDKNVATETTRDQIDALTDLFRVASRLDEATMFRRSVVDVRLANPTKEVLKLHPAVSDTNQFTVSGLTPISLAPNETRDIELVLMPTENALYRDLEVASIDWTVTAEVDGRELQFTTPTPLLPLTTNSISRADSIEVDGDLGDWDALPFAAFKQGDIASAATTPEDISFRFGVRHDGKNLYFGVRVTDDSIVLASDRLAREQDAISVTVDVRDEISLGQHKGAAAAMFDGTLASMTLTFLTPETNPTPDEVLEFVETENLELTRAVVEVDGGYQAELAIPFSVLDRKAGGEWREARIGIRAYDFDQDEHGNVVLYWQPYRFGDAPLAGTGSFRRVD